MPEGVGERTIALSIERRIEDPIALIDNFRTSPTYKNAYTQFYTGKNPTATEEERREAFEMQDIARQTLLTYAQEEKIKFPYSPFFYPQEAQKAIREYEALIKDFTKMNQKTTPTRDEILNYDRQRASYHTDAGRALRDAQIAPSITLGKGMVSLMMITEGQERFSSVNEASFERIKRAA